MLRLLAATARTASTTPPLSTTTLARRLAAPTLGFALLAVAANSLSIWIPSSWLHKVHGMSLVQAGQLTATAMLTAGGAATALGGMWADRWERQRPGGRLMATAALAAVCAPLWLGLLWSNDLFVLGACYTLLAGLGLAWLGPATAEIQSRVPAEARGVSISLYVFGVNLIGYGVAPVVIGALSDGLGSATNPAAIGTALLVCPVACCAAAMVLFTLARQPSLAPSGVQANA
jgi:MFS family permease